jgi:hypothetical protein
MRPPPKASSPKAQGTPPAPGDPDFNEVTALSGKWAMAAEKARASCAERIQETEAFFATGQALKKGQRELLEQALQRDKNQLIRLENFRSTAEISRMLAEDREGSMAPPGQESHERVPLAEPAARRQLYKTDERMEEGPERVPGAPAAAAISAQKELLGNEDEDRGVFAPPEARIHLL